jgi:hypothetical protein
MAKTSKAKSSRGAQVPQKSKPRCLAIARRGIQTSHDFANMMSALMSDLIEGSISPEVGNATCNAGGKLLGIVQLQYKYGKQQITGERVLTLTNEPEANKLPQ